MFRKFRIDHLKLLILHFTLYSSLLATYTDTLWTKTYGGTGADVGYAVLQVDDGGFVIAGQTRSFGSGQSDIYLIRTNADGDTLWTRTYGGDSTELGGTLIQASDGGFVIGGWTRSCDTTKSSDAYLIKTNSDGDTIWTKTYGWNKLESIGSVQETHDGGFITAGFTNSFCTSETDILLLRVNSEGDTLWTKVYGGEGQDCAYSVLQTSDGGFIVTGLTNSFDAVDDDAYLMKTNSYGDTLWVKTYKRTKNDNGGSIHQTFDGGFVILGTSSLGPGGKKIYLIRTDSIGDTLWTKTYTGGTFEFDSWGDDIQLTSDGGFIIAGTNIPLEGNNSDVYIIRTDSIGDTLWTKTFGGPGSDRSCALSPTKDGGFVVVGITNSYGAGDNDIYLIRLDCSIIGIQEEMSSNLVMPDDFIVHGNNNHISIRYTIPYASPIKLEAYNSKGHLITVIHNKFMQKGTYNEVWDCKRYGSGVYFLRLRVNGFEVSKRFTIIR